MATWHLFVATWHLWKVFCLIVAVLCSVSIFVFQICYPRGFCLLSILKIDLWIADML